MFLHAGASLHGHEFSGTGHPPQSPTHAPLQRKRPYLRSAFPAPILRSTTTPPHASTWPLPQTPKATRPVSEVYVRPVTDVLSDPAAARRSVPAAPVVRFKEPEALESPKSSMTEDEPSFYDSDASQTSSTARPRRRRTTPRKSSQYLLALPAPKRGSKKHLFKNIRPRLLFQLQELPGNQRRPRPAIDVFPASLIAGPLVTARYINRFPRIFGAKGELGPRDLILLKSEDYDTGLSDSEEEDEHVGGRREPLAILSPVRGQDCDEIVMEDGTVWRATPGPKGSYNFVHIDEHGITQTARWAKRNPRSVSNSSVQNQKNANRLSSSAATVASDGASAAEPSDYKYTFSLINPQSRRHPILANLSPRSLEVFEDYTTVSTSQGRFPPSRPMSYNFDSAGAKSPPPSPFSVDEPSTERQTQPVDEKTKQLIRVTGLWLALRLGGTASDSAETSEVSAAHPREPSISISSCASQSLKMPRRSTTGNISSTTAPVQSGLRRAVSTGAAFMQRRMMKQSHSQSTEGSSNTVVSPDKQAGARGVAGEHKDSEKETGAGTGCAPAQKQTRRVSWLKKLKH